MKDLLVVLSYTEPRGFLPEYRTQLRNAEIDFHEERMQGFDDSAANVLKLLGKVASEHSDYRWLIFSDAFDVLFYGSRQRILDYLETVPDDKVVYAAERNCWPDPTRASEFPAPTRWRFVNGGLRVGTPEAFIAWSARVAARFPSSALKDQELLNQLVVTGDPDAPILDYQTELFYCLYNERNELKFANDKLWNTELDTFPSFLHANGNYDMFEVLTRRLVNMKALGQSQSVVYRDSIILTPEGVLK